MRLLRNLLFRTRSGTKPRDAQAPDAYSARDIDYDPLVAQLANQCR